MSNSFITLSARAKLNHLLKMGDSAFVDLELHKDGGTSIHFHSSQNTKNGILLCNYPKVIVDLYTFINLKEKSIDFSYDSNELIIEKI